MQYQREPSFAIVGCGLIGRRRFGTLPPGSLKYACDLDEERARHLAAATTNCAPTTDLEAVLDDREERAGAKFADADLIGYPVQVTVGKRGIEAGTVDLKLRATGERTTASLEGATAAVRALLETAP